MRSTNRFRSQYQSVTIERPASIQGQDPETIAMDVKIRLVPMRAFSDFQSVDERPILPRFRANVLDKLHPGVSDIDRFDILKTASGREFVIVNPLTVKGSDTYHLELEEQGV